MCCDGHFCAPLLCKGEVYSIDMRGDCDRAETFIRDCEVRNGWIYCMSVLVNPLRNVFVQEAIAM